MEKWWGRRVAADNKLSIGCELTGKNTWSCGTTWAAAQGMGGWAIFLWSVLWPHLLFAAPSVTETDLQSALYFAVLLEVRARRPTLT